MRSRETTYESVVHRAPPKSVVGMAFAYVCDLCGVHGRVHHCLPRGAAPIDEETFRDNVEASSHRWAVR